MSGQELMKGLSHIDEKYIEEADCPMVIASGVSLRSWALAAACLCVMIAGIWIGRPNSGNEHPNYVTPDTQRQEDKAPDSNVIIMDSTAEELPKNTVSVVMRVEEWTDTGFIGTVVRQEYSDIFPVGMTLTAQYDDSTAVMQDTSMEKIRGQNDSLDQVRLYQVRVISYDEENATVIIGPVLKPVE